MKSSILCKSFFSFNVCTYLFIFYSIYCWLSDYAKIIKIKQNKIKAEKMHIKCIQYTCIVLYTAQYIDRKLCESQFPRVIDDYVTLSSKLCMDDASVYLSVFNLHDQFNTNIYSRSRDSTLFYVFHFCFLSLVSSKHKMIKALMLHLLLMAFFSHKRS